jgi:hypothetical protein
MYYGLIWLYAASEGALSSLNRALGPVSYKESFKDYMLRNLKCNLAAQPAHNAASIGANTYTHMYLS